MILGAFGVNIGGAMTVLDWIGVVLFSAYVIFDMNRAMRLPRTLDNSIDAAVAVYLDFANLFVRLLSLLGQRRDD
jgi:FtsH-binding integral membrane protein